MMNQRHKKPVVLFFALVCGVSSAYALQGGPVMPEYVQFEPADAPDLVNLNTGNFSYTLPLSEVPGPYGGFPLAMSYHAGIGPNQEATWVGLGWTLNPGAINRSLRGVPDDQSHGGDLAFVYAHSATEVTSVNISIPHGPYALNMSYNSMEGYGLNASVGQDFGIFKAKASIGTDGIGLDGSVGFGMGRGGVGLNGSLRYGRKGFSGGGGIGAGYTTAQGASLSASAGVGVSSSGQVASDGGFGLSAKGAHVGYSSTGGVSASYYGQNGLGGSVNLNSHGYSASVSIPGAPGIGVSGASDSRNSSSDNSAGFNVSLFSYSRLIHQSWIRQATSEHSYGYMYQGGPAIGVDGRSDDVATTAFPGQEAEVGGDGSRGSIPWNWNFKGKSLDHVGNPMEGHLYPGYDVFEVASQGVSGVFRTVGLSRHEIFQSVEPLGKAGATDNMSPNVLYYLLKEDTGAAQPPALRRQKLMDFDLEEDTVSAARFTRFAYDYCHDSTEADTLNVHYYGDQSSTIRFQKIKDDLCSRYAVLESNHLNEGNRLLFSRNPRTNLDLNKKFRSRMGFVFLGENGGYFESEDDVGSAKKGRDGLAARLLRKRIQRWKHSPYSNAMEGWEEPVFGARRIEPILEDNSNIGRLKGFKITNADGSQFFFTQPVRSLLSASYTTNQPTGSPPFVDRLDPRADDNVIDILRNTAGTVQDYPVSSWMNKIGSMLKGSVESFLFNSPDFKTPCDDSDQTHTRQYTFSYMMSTNPYATQWLLSEIRGADFVELNPGDMMKNFGYQVKFNYTEPAHYAWRTPYAPPGMSSDSLPNLRLEKNGTTPDNCLSELYHASFGVKELVYLKSIETATHKAEFHLNDLDSNPRIDGKGWVFNWQGDFKKVPNPEYGLPSKPNQRDSILNELRLGIPIMVGTHFPISKSVNLASADNQIAFLYRHDQPAIGGYTPQFISNLRWVRYAVDYSIDRAFLDIQPTEEQIRNMKRGRRIVLTGLSRLVTHDTVRFKAPVPSSDPTDLSYFALHGTNTPPLLDPVGVVPGYKVPAVAPASGFGQEGKILTAIVDTIVRAHGDELQFGSYKILFMAPVPIGRGSLDSGFRLDSGISDSLYFANFDLENPRIPAANSPVVLKLTSGGGDFRGLANQPLLVFNSFVDLADKKASNQMRYLTHVDLLDKQRPVSPYKRFAFKFKNDIMPKTLNSYNLVDNDTVNRIAQHRRSYPTSYDLNNPASDTTRPDTVLQGKLKLESVTELACAGVDCAENLSLPPYRFFYQNPEATPFVAAVKPAPWEPLSVHEQTRMETIRMTGEKQDEWGFYNPNASSGNRKTTQVSADFGGAVWSLNRIVDPSGGVMDVSYERDTYYGEDYSDDRDALGMLWGPCTHNSSRVCLYFMPKKWVAYCDRRDQLQGDWVYTDSAADVGTEYVKEKGFVPGAEMLFNLQQTATTEVKCGVNFGFAKTGDCPRTRSVSVVGSAKIVSTAMAQNVREPLFDAQKYYRDKANGNEIVGECEGRGDCCTFPNLMGGDSIRLGQYWHCGYEAYRIETELSVDSLSKQFDTTVSKLKDRDWDIDGGYNERFGVAWARRSSMVKGGDIRVRDLVKHDIGLSQRTRYEYGVGQLAQYPDSVFSTAFATRFSTGKITDILGTGFKHDYFKSFRRIPSQSRIPGISDEDIFLLPGSNISYPKVTISNVIEKGGKVSVLNGKMEFEFHGPEQIGFLDIHIDSFTTASGLPVRSLFADYFDSTNARIFTRDRFDIKNLGLQGLGNSSVHVYRLVRMDDSDPQGRKASHIRRVRFYSDFSGTEAMDDSLDIVLNQGTPASPKVNLYLKGSLSAGGVFTLNRDPTQGVSGESHEEFDFPTPVLVKGESGDSVAYLDFTSRIGKTKATSYYRWLPDTAGQRPGKPGHYALIKRDSMVYASKAPSVDHRFIAGADSARVGRFKEVWSYARVRKCDSTATDPNVVDCRDDKDTSQWKVYKDMPRHKTVTHTRFPTFLTRAKSITGFTGSRQPDNSALGGGTDFITTSVTNHFFDPITGQPTLTVYHAGPTDGSPSKVTRMTPAYAADSGQLTDLPMVMFAKNMLEANFRTDAFTFKDSTTVANFDAPSLVSGTNGDNGGSLAPYLTAVTVTPYRHQFLSVVDSLPSLAEDTLGLANVTEPITNLGTFIPRFALSRALDSIPRNRDLFTRKPGLQSWKGSHIAQVNRFLKPLEARDAYGRITSNRFDPRGFHQTGLFGNAPYKETAVLTPDGFVAGMTRLGEWTVVEGLPVLERGYLTFGTPFSLWQPFDLSKNTSYVVECQLYSPNTTEIDVEFRDASGTEWALQTIFIQPGVRTYRVVLDSARWLGNPPPGGANRLWVRSNLNGDKVGIKYLRAYPKKAEAMTYVYSERGDMIQSVDVSGVSTYFEYDLFGKLTAIRNDDGVMLTAGSREQTNQ